MLRNCLRGGRGPWLAEYKPLRALSKPSGGAGAWAETVFEVGSHGAGSDLCQTPYLGLEGQDAARCPVAAVHQTLGQAPLVFLLGWSRELFREGKGRGSSMQVAKEKKGGQWEGTNNGPRIHSSAPSNGIQVPNLVIKY